LSALLFLDGSGATRSGLPTLAYVNRLQNCPRPSDGQTDIGAYEYRVPAFSAIRVSGNDCLLDFTTVTNNHYDLQRFTTLTGGVWFPVVTNIPGIDGTLHVTDTNGATQPSRFYRLKAST
jgi:hypothetical protein